MDGFCSLHELDLTLFYKIEGYFENPKSLMTENDRDLNDRTLQVTPLLTKIKSHEIIIFHKKNIIRYFCLFNPKTFLIFAQKVQYNTLLDMKIQEVMKLQRKALGITQQDLADMSEIAISTIKKIESGKGNPSLSTVEKIMNILGMEVKYEIRQTV